MDKGIPMLFIGDDAEATGPQGFLDGVAVLFSIRRVAKSFIKRGGIYDDIVLAIPRRLVYDVQDFIEQFIGLLTQCLMELLLGLFRHQLGFGTGIVFYPIPAMLPKQYRYCKQYR